MSRRRLELGKNAPSSMGTSPDSVSMLAVVRRPVLYLGRSTQPELGVTRSEVSTRCRGSRWGAPFVGACCSEISDSISSGSLSRPANRNGKVLEPGSASTRRLQAPCRLISPGSARASRRLICRARISVSPRRTNSTAATALLARKTIVLVSDGALARHVQRLIRRPPYDLASADTDAPYPRISL
jgi:hypothetical protein